MTQLCIMQIVSNLVSVGMAVLLPGMRAELAFGPIESGWVGAARLLGQVLILPATIVLVRFAPIPLWSACLLLAAVSSILVGLAASLPLIILGLMLHSVGIGFVQIPANLVRLQWVPRREMATVWGVAMAVNGCVQTAILMGIPYVVEQPGGWRSVFLAIGAVLFAVVGLWAVTARERITPGYRAARSAERGLSAVRGALRRREFYLLGLASLAGGGAFATTMLFLPSYLTLERGFSLAAAGAIVGVMPAGGVTAAVTMGFISDRIGRRKPLIWPAGLILPVLYLLLLSPLPPLALGVLGFLIGYLTWGPFPAINTIPYELPGISPAEVAIGHSLIQTVHTLGAVLGPIVVGSLAASTGLYRLGILPMAFVPLVLTLGSLTLPETGPRARVRG